MRNGRWRMARVAAAACLLALAGAGGASVVAARRASMHEAGVVMHALWADVLAGRPTAALLGRARWVAAWAGHLPDLFPPGSDGGATNALPGVWSDPAGFAARAKALRVAARAMVAAAEAGDRPGFAAAFRATDYACGQCHRDFRHR